MLVAWAATLPTRIHGSYHPGDDVVPSTNFALPLCYVYDVTGSKERSAFLTPTQLYPDLHPNSNPDPTQERSAFPPPDTGNFLQDVGLRLLGFHNWPIGYLARHYETTLDANGEPVVPSHEQLPRGTVKKVA
jgi:hypothetical protein